MKYIKENMVIISMSKVTMNERELTKYDPNELLKKKGVKKYLGMNEDELLEASEKQKEKAMNAKKYQVL